jgi:hypothetical protein
MANCQSTLNHKHKRPKYKHPLIWPSSLHTLLLTSTYDPSYCKSSPSDRNPEGKGEAIKYNSYTRYLNKIRDKNCNLK